MNIEIDNSVDHHQSQLYGIEHNEYAGFWLRFFARLIDAFVALLIIVLLLTTTMLTADYAGVFNDEMRSLADLYVDTVESEEYSIVEIISNPSFLYFNIITFLMIAVYPIYEILFLSSKHQATLGKKALKIYVGNKDGSKISIAKSFVRVITFYTYNIAILLFIPLLISILMLIFSKEKASLHDKIFSTRVFCGKVKI